MEEEIDLLEQYELLPDNVQDILETFNDNNDLYKECRRVINNLKSVGYTADYDLSGTMYGLREMTELEKALESQEFHDLMSNYRIADMNNQERVIENFETVKRFILSKV